MTVPLNIFVNSPLYLSISQYTKLKFWMCYSNLKMYHVSLEAHFMGKTEQITFVKQPPDVNRRKGCLNVVVRHEQT